MTVSSTVSKVTFNGNGSTTAFPMTGITVFQASDIVVTLRKSDNTETVQTLTTHYTVSGTLPGVPTVNMVTAPASGEKLVCQRVLPLTQETDYLENDPFPAETHERALDRLTMISQQLSETIAQSVALKVSSSLSGVEFPEPGAGKVIAWNADGLGLEATTDLGNWKGAWAAGTAYAARDLVRDGSTNNIYVAVMAHTSGASVAADVSGGKLGLVIDAAAVATSASAAASSATAAGASADLAARWAEEAEDTPVASGQFSALHHAAKAAASAASIDHKVLDTDLDTGLEVERTADDDTVWLKTLGTDRVRVASNGRVGLGAVASAPDTDVHLRGSAPVLRLEATDNTAVTLDGRRNATAADATLLALAGNWNGDDVAAVRLVSGADTGNKDDGRIVFLTQPDNVTGLVSRGGVRENGRWLIGAGATPDGLLHVHNASAGTVTASGAADELVLENSGAVGLSLLSPNTATASIYFGDPESNSVGRIEYVHSGNGLQFFTDNARVLLLSNAASAVNYLTIFPAATGGAVRLLAAGADTNIDLRLQATGSGRIWLGPHAAIGAETITGTMTVKDSNGVERKLAVVS